jgi:hypothetical protein
MPDWHLIISSVACQGFFLVLELMIIVILNIIELYYIIMVSGSGAYKKRR